VNRIYYYCSCSSPATPEDTNLQLYSLRKAADNWNNLIDSIEKQGIADIDELKEKLVFILNCLGLSLGQLLGQNFSSSDKKRVDDLKILFKNFLDITNVDENVRNHLIIVFNDFLMYYDSLRHFGLIKHPTIDQLNIEKLDQCLSMTINIWDMVIKFAKEDDENKIGISSVTEIISFKEYKHCWHSDHN
jgi:hypothetical protein